MKQRVAIAFLFSCVLAGACKKPSTGSGVEPSDQGARAPASGGFGLVAARAKLRTKIFHDSDKTPAAEPPPALFRKTRYRRGSDELVAYESPAGEAGKPRPAILWIAGGFDWGIGESAWAPADRANDQSAAALREAGLILMLPALRGSNENPGRAECFLGEVDDILAAAEHLASRPDVDPQRIYLGGHSTGGTLALLAAASTDRFRAVFAFGPVHDPQVYGANGCLPEGQAAEEYQARAPVEWLHQVVTPTYVIEGERGNVAVFPLLSERASKAVTLVTVPDTDHFSVLRPGSEVVARAILADTGAKATISLDAAEISRTAAR